MVTSNTINKAHTNVYSGIVVILICNQMSNAMTTLPTDPKVCPLIMHDSCPICQIAKMYCVIVKELRTSATLTTRRRNCGRRKDRYLGSAMKPT